MSDKTLLVITPDEGRDCVFNILNAETGEHLASHLCSHEGFARSDLYDGRPERKEEWGKRFGEIEVKFLGQTDLEMDVLLERNKAFHTKDES